MKKIFTQSLRRKLNSLIDFQFFLLVILIMPILVIWHELGHILLGWIFGFKIYFFFTAALVIPTKSSACYPNCNLEEFIVHLGGPIFSWLAIMTGYIGFLRTLKKYFLLGLAVIAPFIYNFLWLLLGLLISGKATTLSDEVKIAQNLKIPPILLSGFFVLIGIILLLVCYLNIKPGYRLRLVTASVLGVLTFYILFWVVLAPFFRPDYGTLWKIFSGLEHKIEPL